MYMSGFCIFLLLPFPVDIYYVTRIILCIGAIYGALKLYHLNPNSNKVLLLGITAVIFNPLFPFYFQVRSIWMLMDIFAAYVFYVSSKEFKNQPLTQSTRANKKPQESKDFRLGLDRIDNAYKEIQKSLNNEQRSENLSQKVIKKNYINLRN